MCVRERGVVVWSHDVSGDGSCDHMMSGDCMTASHDVR